MWTDDVIAVEQQNSNLSFEEIWELNFCNSHVLTNTWWFIQYGWDEIVSRCENLAGSGNSLVTNTYYFHKNHLWSIMWITDENGNIVSEYEYDSFWNFTLSGTDIWNTRLFTWREFDFEIWLYYNRARYYSSDLWRFISRDPIGQIDDVNLYGYVANNPVMFRDPMGTDKKNIIVRWLTTLTVLETMGWFWIAWVFNDDIKFWNEFLWNSFRWVKEIKYYDKSDYVIALKDTSDYQEILKNISSELDKWNLEKSVSTSSTDDLAILTLWHYDYNFSAQKTDNYYDINIKITDTYDFNKEPYNSFMNNYLNVMHDANNYWILTPMKVEININHRIYEK